MGMIGFYYLLIGVMAIWMAIKVGRDSTGMGIATLVFWPIAVIPLITNWGQRDSDIRLQFVVAAIASVMLMNSSATLLNNNPALMYGPDEIAQIRAEDPVFAAEIERDQMRALGVEIVPEATDDRSAGAVTTFATISMEPVGSSRRALGPVNAPAPQQAEMEFTAAPAQIHKVALRELNFRRGQVRLAPAYAYLRVPEHFRFVAKHQLGLLSEIRGVAVSEQTLGWVVHERVDLRSPHFWFADVQFHAAGHLAAPPIDAPAASGVRWDPQLAVASFSHVPGDAAKGQDQVSARLLRHGALVFRVPGLAGDQLELGLRVARLLSSQVQIDSGWAYSDFDGGTSPQALLQWVSALDSDNQPGVMAESGAGAVPPSG